MRSFLLPSESRKDVGGDDADAEQNAGGGQNKYHCCGKELGPQGVNERAHDFFVVDEKKEEDQSRGHGQDRDYIYDENHVDKRQARNENNTGASGGAETEDGVKRLAFSHGQIEAVRLVRDFAEGVGGRS